jgi:hypothetical protein
MIKKFKKSKSEKNLSKKKKTKIPTDRYKMLETWSLERKQFVHLMFRSMAIIKQLRMYIK